MVGGRHARLWRDDKGWRLESHEARDGVWIRIEKPVPVDRKCLFQLGEQRFNPRSQSRVINAEDNGTLRH